MGQQDAGDQAFGALGMMWPIIKEAIEQSIRKSWCTVRWQPEDARGELPNDWLCADAENDCLTIGTFWTDVEKLKQLPALGGEADGTDDDPGGEDGGDNSGADPRRPPGSVPGGGGGRNPAIPPGPGMGPGGGLGGIGR